MRLNLASPSGGGGRSREGLDARPNQPRCAPGRPLRTRVRPRSARAPLTKYVKSLPQGFARRSDPVAALDAEATTALRRLRTLRRRSGPRPAAPRRTARLSRAGNWTAPFTRPSRRSTKRRPTSRSCGRRWSVKTCCGGSAAHSEMQRPRFERMHGRSSSTRKRLVIASTSRGDATSLTRPRERPPPTIRTLNATTTRLRLRRWTPFGSSPRRCARRSPPRSPRSPRRSTSLTSAGPTTTR